MEEKKKTSFSFSSQFLSFFNTLIRTVTVYALWIYFTWNSAFWHSANGFIFCFDEGRIGSVEYASLFFTWPNLKGIANRQYHKVVQSFSSLPVANVCSFSILLCNLVTHRLAIKTKYIEKNLKLTWLIYLIFLHSSTPTGRNQLKKMLLHPLCVNLNDFLCLNILFSAEREDEEKNHTHTHSHEH